jgi:predicted nucleotidyltransferase/uncharacterized protein (UPF0332 family)
MASRAAASLTEAERRALDRLVDALQRELGDDLHAVWLYGSRARGEPPRDEDSDVDLLVITTRPDRETPERVRQHAAEAAEVEGLMPHFDLSVFVSTPEWVWQRRAVGAFYMREVDRDKIVLAGGEVPAPPDYDWHEPEHGVRLRTREYLRRANVHLQGAKRALEAGPEPAVVAAYDVVLEAARAVQSEADRFVRTHKGTWQMVREVLVDTGRLPPELHAAAHALLARRMYALYGLRTPTRPCGRRSPSARARP